MSDTQCAQQGQLFVVAHDLKRPAGVRASDTQQRWRLSRRGIVHGAERQCWRVAVYRDRHSGIYFDSARGDEKLWTAGGLWHEPQCALRAALRDVHPLFIYEEPAEAQP
jgi:hypothetical protein